MAINVIVQYNGGFLPDILPLFLYGSMALFSYIITTLLTMYYIVFCFVMFGCYVWWPCMAINVSVQYNGGLLPNTLYCWPKVTTIKEPV